MSDDGYVNLLEVVKNIPLSGNTIAVPLNVLDERQAKLLTLLDKAKSDVETHSQRVIDARSQMLCLEDALVEVARAIQELSCTNTQ